MVDLLKRSIASCRPGLCQIIILDPRYYYTATKTSLLWSCRTSQVGDLDSCGAGAPAGFNEAEVGVRC